jgi:uncharacterized SAM-binding protein YcdF (DUF218 family)
MEEMARPMLSESPNRSGAILKPVRDLLAAARTLGERILVVERPGKADLIVVLGGDSNGRVRLALRLFSEGWAPRIVIPTSSSWQIFGRTETALGEEFVRSLPPGFRDAAHILPSAAESTFEEAVVIGEYMDAVGATSALLVTSDYHTRRALSVFSRVLPEKRFRIRGVADLSQFAPCWWRRRAWAKRALAESSRLAWWLLFRRWRRPPVVTPAARSPVISDGALLTHGKLDP